MRRALGWTFALVALGIAVSPWAGAVLPVTDRWAVALPAAPPLAILALLLHRGRGAAIALAALLIAAVPLVREAWPIPRDAGSGARLVIVSHNVADANRDPAGTARALAASGADVLLLQEVGGRFRPQLAGLRRVFPFGSACRGCSLAILSRLPMGRVRYRFRDAEGAAFGPPLVQGEVTIAGRAVTVASIHLTRGGSATERAGQRADLVAAIARRPDPGLILGGDFNLTPWQASFRALADGLLPLARADRGFATFPAHWGERAVPWPLVDIDHLFAGPLWTVAAVRRLPKTGSDHYAIRIDLVLRTARL